MKEHNDLPFKIPQALTEARAQRANPVIVDDHFNKLHKVIKEHSLSPEEIWNMDETGFIISPRLEKVIVKKGSRQVHKVAHKIISHFAQLYLLLEHLL